MDLTTIVAQPVSVLRVKLSHVVGCPFPRNVLF